MELPQWLKLARTDEEAASVAYAFVFAEKLWPKMFRAHTAEEQLAAFRQAFIETISPDLDLRATLEAMKPSPFAMRAGGDDAMDKAREQVLEVLERRGQAYVSAVPKYSRAFSALSELERSALLEELREEGLVAMDGRRLTYKRETNEA